MNPLRIQSLPERVDVRIPSGRSQLIGLLDVPEAAEGLVMFVHGSGSGRHSPRNQYVATALRQKGLATLLFDLLTEEEEHEDADTGHLRFDIDLLAGRLRAATAWAREQPTLTRLPLGYFGASTGAAAALVAATKEDVQAVVSRGGRPDLAGAALAKVLAPTLLIVGNNDREVLALNREALARLESARRLAVVPGAGHLFEEPGALDQVIALATDWFDEYLLAGSTQE